MRIVRSAFALIVLASLSADGRTSGARTWQDADRPVRRVTWQDVAPIHARLEARGFSAGDFDARVERLARDNARRVRLGDLDHLVFYVLQSSRYTTLPSIEPALSARSLVAGLDAQGRETFLREPAAARRHVGSAVRARVKAFLGAIAAPRGDARLTYFGRLLVDEVPAAEDREAALVSEYLRVMRFVHEKEFGAGRTEGATAAGLYRTRGLSTDTAVEAGFLVAQGAGVLRALDPDRRVRRVLIIGAGLDIAPRTALLEAAPPQSYQPWAVLDALVGLGLSTLDDVEVVAADINPRVVDHVRLARASAPVLLLVSGIGDGGRVVLAGGYREYFAALGRSIGTVGHRSPAVGSRPPVPAGHLFTRLRISQDAARVVRAERLDVVTERLAGRPFDLVVATNVFPYFDDDALGLALANIAGMLDAGGVLLHNEARPALHDMAVSLGLPPSHSRHAVIATVEGAAPLGDSIWLHRRPGVEKR